jgi:RND family efflux transporter MFP subunit
MLLPAMTARVVINTADKADALVVPLSALKTDAQGSYVFVLKEDGTQEQRYVETGIYSDEYVEILSGLDEGERVVNTYTSKAAKAASSVKQDGGPPPF